jgi:hypothetical protein
MDTQSNAIRPLSAEECDTVSGAVGSLVAFLVLAGGAAVGAGAALLIYGGEEEEEVLVPDIQFPS